MKSLSSIRFKEKQRFTQWWLWLLLGGLLLLLLYGFFNQVVLRRTFGDNSAPNWLLVLILIIMFGILILFYRISLIMQITEKEIFMHYRYFETKRILWKNVKNAAVVQYGFVGWGIRMSSQYGTIYNVKGNKGVAFELLSGEKFLIGTQKAEELKRILETIQKND